MNVGDLCQKEPVTAMPSDDLVKVAELMRDKHVGSVIVVEPAVRESAFRPIGIVTDRDIVITVVARDADARFLLVNDVMTREPAVVTEDESLGGALKKMRKIGVRRLPVVGKQDELVGVIALDDIIDALVRELESVAGSIRSEQMIEHSLRP